MLSKAFRSAAPRRAHQLSRRSMAAVTGRSAHTSTHHDYFSRAVPPAPSAQPITLLAGSRLRDHEALSVRQLELITARPRSNDQPQSSVSQSDETWAVYCSLSPACRQALPQLLLQRVLRHIVPPADIVRALQKRRTAISLKPGKEVDATLANMTAPNRSLRWEKRLALVMSDMSAAPTSASSGPYPTLHDYNFVMRHFATLGHVAGCEALASEMSARGLPINIKTINARLAALAQWLASQPALSVEENQYLALNMVERIKSILLELHQAGIPCRRITLDHLLTLVHRLGRDYAPNLAVLDSMYEEILERGYSANNTLGLDGAPDARSSEPAGLPSISVHTLNVVIDDLGSRATVWEMFSALETLGGSREGIYLDRQSTTLPQPKAPGVAVTLTEAAEREAASADRLSFFGRPQRQINPTESNSADQDPAQPRLSVKRACFRDFLSSQSLPSAVYRQYLDPQSTLPAPYLLHAYNRHRQPSVNTQTFTLLVQHAAKTGDFDVALHALRTAIQEAFAVRGEWYAAYAHALRQTQLEEKRLGSKPSVDDIHRQLIHPALSPSQKWFKPVLGLGKSPTALAKVGDELRIALAWIADELQLWKDEAGKSEVDAARATVLKRPIRVRRDHRSFNLLQHLQLLQNHHDELRVLEHAVETSRATKVARKQRRTDKRRLARGALERPAEIVARSSQVTTPWVTGGAWAAEHVGVAM